eukprot:TRINITY_DN3704_c0_g2_i1.p1 TRINITY_DN3704_c0_g2~~TRINITY_DN3704_c0_g2_i1.p1  ORF type:complete len:245 (+),score=22.16 TRINITY_DN3704_c0_g2_i1:57-791(+)
MSKAIIVFAALSLLIVSVASQSRDLYANVRPDRYLLGKFDPNVNDDFQWIEFMATNYRMRLRNEVASMLKNMYHVFNNETGISFPLVSATRNFDLQSKIWTDKWNGPYSNIPDPYDRARAILQWSSMPGTSRHHWGTDFDLYSLDNADFNSGKGKVIYDWLKNNAYKFGFCQPYTAGRTQGYNEERWHWSYCPYSSQFLKDWNYYYSDVNNFIGNVSYVGREAAGHLAPIYVNTINEDCKTCRS